MKKYLLLIFLSASFVSVYGQNVSFLCIESSPRNTAMGGSGLAIGAGAFSIFTNLSSAAVSEDRGAVGYSYTPWMRDIVSGSNLNTAAGYLKLADRHITAAGFRNLTDGKYRQYGDTGEDGGWFRPRHMSLELGYAYIISAKLAVSATLRYVESEISDLPEYKKASAVGADVGITYSCNAFRAAFALSNAGSRIDYGQGGKSDMPMWIKGGAAYSIYPALRHCLTGTADLAWQIHEGNDGIVGGVGAEYTYRESYSLRGGLRFGDEKKTSPCYGTLGGGLSFGLKKGFIRGFNVDFAYLITEANSPLKNTFQLGAGIRF